MGEVVARRKQRIDNPLEGTLIKFNLLGEGDFVAAKAVIQEVDPLLKRNIFAVMHKRIHSIDSFAKYVARQLVRDGIFCDYSSSITPLPDGFRLTIEVRLVAINMDIVKRKIKYLYESAFDIIGNLRWFRSYEKRAEEESRIAVEQAVIEGSLNVDGVGNKSPLRSVESPREEGEEGQSERGGADNQGPS